MFITFKAIDSPERVSSNKQPRYVTVWYCLMCISPYLISRLLTLLSLCFVPNLFCLLRNECSVYYLRTNHKLSTITNQLNLIYIILFYIHKQITNQIQTITNQKKIKPIANGDAADSSMIALTDEPLPCWKPKKEWKFKCKSWIKKLINCCFSQIKTKHNLTACLMYLCCFFSYLYQYLDRYWAS